MDVMFECIAVRAGSLFIAGVLKRWKQNFKIKSRVCLIVLHHFLTGQNTVYMQRNLKSEGPAVLL